MTMSPFACAPFPVFFGPFSFDRVDMGNCPPDYKFILVRRPSVQARTHDVNDPKERLVIIVDCFAADGPGAPTLPVASFLVDCQADDRDRWDLASGGTLGKPRHASTNAPGAYVTADLPQLLETLRKAQACLSKGAWREPANPAPAPLTIPRDCIGAVIRCVQWTGTAEDWSKLEAWAKRDGVDKVGTTLAFCEAQVRDDAMPRGAWVLHLQNPDPGGTSRSGVVQAKAKTLAR